MPNKTLFILALLAMCFAWAVPVPARAFDVATKGKVQTKVLYQEGDAELVVSAATELARVLGIMTGDEVTAQAVKGAADAKGAAILLGALAEQAGLKMNKQSEANDGFRYKVQGGQVLIVGESPRGVYVGTHKLLESLGCGWYVPGPVGEVIPKKADVTLADNLDHTEVSTSMHRRFWYGGGGMKEYDNDWARRLNGHYSAGGWIHAYNSLVPKSHFKEHPEWFALQPNGERRSRQLCTTNPQVIALSTERMIDRMNKAEEGKIVFSAGPNDGGGLCECDQCMALRTEGYLEPSTDRPNASSQVFQFATEIAERSSKVHPDKFVGVYVYSDYSRPPKKIEKLHPNVFPMVGPIRRCRLHGPGNPLCEWNMLLEEEIIEWTKISGGTMGFYMYNFNLADTQVPFPKLTAYKRYQDVIHKANITRLAWTFETIDSWAIMAPAFWLSVRLSWDHTLDIDEEMKKFYNGFYGAAAEPMARYWNRIDQAYATTDAHTGSQYALHHIFTPEVLSGARQDIEQAKALASNDREKEAVAMAEGGLRAAEYFMASWNALGNFEFDKAAKIEDEYNQFIEAHGNEVHRPSWFRNNYARGYHQRFVGNTIRSGDQIVDSGGIIIAKLPDQWQFAADEDASGLEKGWNKPEFDASSWRTVGTFTQSWSDIGVGFGGFYHGDAWYRTTFKVPADAKGKDLRLWFGGFDHNVDVYINGQSIGELKGFVKPGELDNVEDALKYGEDNVIIVRTSAGGLAELGTGGIMMPVMLYAAPAEAGDGGEDGKGKDTKGTEYEM